MSRTPNEERFIYMANLLREYININKTAPRLYDLYKGENIGSWFATQRKLYKEGNLLQNRILILENVVGEFYSSEITYREKRFIYMTNLLKEYIDTYKMLPKKTDIYKGENIGSWFATQRKLYREGKLLQNRINILKSTIGKFI